MTRAVATGLLLITLAGIACSAQVDLGGTWETDIVLDLGPGTTWPNDVTIDSTISIDYVVQNWTFGASTELENGVWTEQGFTAAGPIAAIDISSDLDFDVANATVASWIVNSSFAIGGLHLGVDATLEPNSVALDVTAGGTSGSIAVDAAIGFGDAGVRGCAMGFQGLELGVTFPFCCAEVDASIEFDCAGFDHVEFCVDGLGIAALPWLDFDVCLNFTEQTKSFILSPSIDLGLVGCDFDLYYHLDPDDDIVQPGHGLFAVDGILFDGLQVVCDVGGVQFTGITYFGDSPPGILSGTTYWEAYQISTTDDGCCGPFSFDVTVYFAKNGTRLFDVAFFDANLEIELSASLTVDMVLELDVENAAMGEWRVGFEVTF